MDWTANSLKLLRMWKELITSVLPLSLVSRLWSFLNAAVALFEFIKRHRRIVKLPLVFLIPIQVNTVVLRTCWPNVKAFSVLLPVPPCSLESLSVGIVKNAKARAVIFFELAVIDLAVRPEIQALAALLAGLETAIVYSTIGPLEQALAVHRIVNERSLVDFTPRSNSSTPTVYLSLNEKSFENRIVGVDFESEPIWSLCLNWLLTSEHRTRPSLVEV